MTPARVSSPELRGLAYWPAIRPILTIGTCAAYVSTTAIESSVRSLPWMLAAVTPSNVSAQSPPCRMNASPAATLAILVRSLSHSAAKTSGGSLRNRRTTSVHLALVGIVRLLQRAQRMQRFQRRDAASLVDAGAVGDTQTL